jgi:hypothetical protein
MPQGLAERLASDSYQHQPWPLLAAHADDADGAEGSPGPQPLGHPQLAKTSIVYRRTYGAALGAPLWST